MIEQAWGWDFVIPAGHQEVWKAQMRKEAGEMIVDTCEGGTPILLKRIVWEEKPYGNDGEQIELMMRFTFETEEPIVTATAKMRERIATNPPFFCPPGTKYVPGYPTPVYPIDQKG